MNLSPKRRSSMNPIVVKALGTSLLACALLARGGHALAQGGYPYSGMKIVASKQPFESLVGRLEKSIAASGMGLVAQASASRAAAARCCTGLPDAGSYEPEIIEAAKNEHRLATATLVTHFKDQTLLVNKKGTKSTFLVDITQGYHGTQLSMVLFQLI